MKGHPQCFGEMLSYIQEIPTAEIVNFALQKISVNYYFLK
jgi:hypothetical protein